MSGQQPRLDPAQVSALLTQRAPREVRTISRVLGEAGHRSWIVGGCVRDAALSLLFPERPPRQGDWDMATTARPEQVQKLFRRVIPTGIQHGTVTIVLGGQHFEVTTLRGERGHSDGRRPDEVFFVEDLREDLLRRDFTVNAIAYDLEAAELSDPFGGLGDAERGLIRAVGQALRRFEEDGLRVLRGARFCATLGFELEAATRDAMAPSLGSFDKVAFERIRDEWFKALSSSAPSRFARVVAEQGMLERSAPELQQEGAPWEQTLQLVDAAPPDPLLRLALWTARTTPDAARELASRFRLSKQERGRLVCLVEHAHLPSELHSEPPAAELRRYLARVGRDAIEEVLTMQSLMGAAPLAQVHRELRKVAESDAPLSLKELAVQGGDLIADGLPPGPAVGQTLQALLEATLKDPQLNERAALLTRARELRALEGPEV